MRPTRALSKGVVAVAAAALVSSALAAPAGAGPSSSTAAAAGSGESASYVVLAKTAAGASAVAAKLRARGDEVTSVNSDVGVVGVRSDDAAFREHASAISGVEGVAGDRVIGEVPDGPAAGPKDPAQKNAVEKENAAALAAGQKASTLSAPKRSTAKAAAAAADPLDGQLWGMLMIRADLAHGKTLGNPKVRVGVIDTGVDGSHPDIGPNFDNAASRNFVTDLPFDELGQVVDGPCEFRGCVDPNNWDDQGHGTHVAGTIAAAANGLGVSGVAPKVKIVNVRAGQDSGFFFLQSVVDALTYAGQIRLNVVNMSFYVDPWLFNCRSNPADSPDEQAEQRTIIAAVSRALDYAHRRGVTLVNSAGNEHNDLANPHADDTSPDFPANTSRTRVIDNATCKSLPVEGPHVLGVTALGPSGNKADYSNYTSAPSSGEVEISGPGGWFRDYFGTPNFRTNENLILSTAPRNVMLAAGNIDANGDVTPAGVALGVQKDCPAAGPCGYYQFLQGTSMASPHVTGVAALAIGRHGRKTRTGFGMNPDSVRTLLLRTAMNRPCPVPPTVDYLDEGRDASFTATCVGTTARNGFYGEGIANAWGVVR